MDNFQNQNQQDNFNQLPQRNLKKQIPSWIAFVIIALAAVVLFGGVFAYQYFATKNNNAEPTNQTAGPAPSGVEGWKTYTNTEYGFEFKYPKEFADKDKLVEFKERDCSSATQDFFFKNYTSFPLLGSGGTNGGITAEILCLNDNLGGESVKSLIEYLEKNIKEQKYGMMDFSDISKINFGGNNYKFSSFSLGHQDTHILIKLKDNLILILSFGYFPNYNTGENVIISNLDKILSTFKFIN